MDVAIRVETAADIEAIRGVNVAAFEEVEHEVVYEVTGPASW